jgi:hypothetical protein
MNEAELHRVYHEAREALTGHHGVVGVSLGLRERAGELVQDETVLRVYVERKLPVDELAPGAELPVDYAGVPIDVHEVTPLPLASYANEDRAHYPVVIGGIGVGTGRTDLGRFKAGTIGFVAIVPGLASPKNVALVTNHHVVSHDGGRIGDVVYQPDQTAGMPNHAIGWVLKLPEKKDYPYRYPPALRAFPDEPEAPFWVDCASARLDISISSCCDCNCGVSFANRINALGLAGGDALTGVARARHGETVFKVGWRTGRTQGRVTDVNRTVGDASLASHGVLEVTFVSATHPDVTKFSDEGDSGAAIVNQDGKLVGVLYSADTDPKKSLCSHIHPLLHVLEVIPVIGQIGNPAQTTAALLPAILGGGRGEIAELRERFVASAEGARIAMLVERHRQEVVYLVNHVRRVTIAWHRNQGPAFLNRVIANARDPEVPIPYEIDGVTREQLLRTMHSALAAHGSVELHAALDAHADEVIERVRSYHSVHDVVDALEVDRQDTMT